MDYDRIEYLFEELWQELPKGEIIKRERRRIVALEAGNLRIIVFVIIGPRGGLSYWFDVYDPEPAILADRILASGIPQESPGPLDLQEMNAAKRNQAVEQVVEEALRELVRSQHNWRRYERASFANSAAPPVLNGGLPSLGSRRR